MLSFRKYGLAKYVNKLKLDKMTSTYTLYSEGIHMHSASFVMGSAFLCCHERTKVNAIFPLTSQSIMGGKLFSICVISGNLQLIILKNYWRSDWIFQWNKKQNIDKKYRYEWHKFKYQLKSNLNNFWKNIHSKILKI